MQVDQTPFRPGWKSFNLRGYRRCTSTYCLFDYASLPALDQALFRGILQWLTPLEASLRDIMQDYWPTSADRQQVLATFHHLASRAEKMDLKLPEAFTRLMGTLDLQERMPSCTACYFDLPEHIVQSPFGDGGYFIRFLNDQQWVLLWHLYLAPDGDHCVVVSSAAFDDVDYGQRLTASGEQWTPDVLRERTFFCAPTFEAFLYRFWIENHIWFALNERYALTEEQQHYAQRLRAG
jgi:hypothetical protein